MGRFEMESVRRHFDEIAEVYDAGKERQWYYYDYLVRIYKEHVPPHSSVLDVGCGTGSILHRLEPTRGVGLDLSPRMVHLARAKYPNLEFRVEDIARPVRRERYDFVLLSDVLEHLPDLEAALEGLKAYGDGATHYIATCANPLWAPILHLAEALRLKLPEGDHEWIALRELCRSLERHNFKVERAEGRMLVPKQVPFLSHWLNGWAERSSWWRPLCLIQVLVFSFCSEKREESRPQKLEAG